MREFVPERGGPAERARRTRPRRIERHHASEAGAEGADHPRQPGRAHGEVVVLREHLDQDGPVGREAVAFGERGDRRLRQRLDERRHHRRFVAVELEHEPVSLDRRELLEGVEQGEQVVGDRVVGIEAERRVEFALRPRLVAGAHELHPEFRPGAGVLGVERHAEPRDRRGLVEAIVLGDALADHTVNLAEPRVDRERRRHRRIVVGAAVLEVGH